MEFRIQGLVAATHTPFSADGEIELKIVEHQAERLLRDGIEHVFIGGTTGESTSLTVDERLQLNRRWSEVVKGSSLKVVVHVGTNCLADSQKLASFAEEQGAVAISALAPSYFKPASIEALIDWNQAIASSAPGTPYYFYDIPSMTGVSYPMIDFLKYGHERIDTLAGLKFTNTDLIAYQQCRDLMDGSFDILFGVDEILLAALAFGCQGAVGSTYNFAASIYLRIQDAFSQHDFERARREQLRCVKLVQILAKRGYMASAKRLMALRGVEVGPPRLPISRLDDRSKEELDRELVTEFSDLLQ